MAVTSHDTAQDERSASKASSGSTFRPELHGLRGLAIMLVVLFHVFADGRVSGGIDVFLGISGFLYTASLLRRVEAGAAPGEFWFGALARLARRLLPAALITLVVVGIVGWWLLPSTGHAQLARELTATVLYRENWELIDSQLAYGAAGPETSPLQHFWSLSVQGQFYLLWVLGLGGLMLLARRLGRSPRVATWWAVGGIAVVSFAFALVQHGRDQQIAYYHTGARLWELALLGLAALCMHRVQLPATLRGALGWAGVIMIVTCGWLFDGAALFPGPLALWPLIGLALVLVAGDTGLRVGADRMLTTRPLRWLGDVAYPLYLWHWPLLIFLLVATDRESVGLWLGAVVLAGSLVLAAWTQRLIDAPLGRLKIQRPIRVVAVGLLAVGLAAGGSLAWQQDMAQRQDEAQLEAETVDPVEYPGAAALDPETGPFPERDPIPRLESAELDRPDHYDRDCMQGPSETDDFEVLVCDDRRPDSDRTIVITGGSHALMWVTAVEELAEEHNWSVVVVNKSGCQLTSNTGQYSLETDHLPSPSCQEWNRGAMDVIEGLEPDVVLTMASTTVSREERYSRGFVDAWRMLQERDIPVIAMRDSIRVNELVPTCLEETDMDIVGCGLSRAEGLMPEFGAANDPDLPDNVIPVDLTDYICEPDWCPAVVGNVVVYRDSSHLSATYVRTLAPYLEQELRAGAAWLFEAP